MTQPVPARIRKTRAAISAVWLIPLIALLTGGWLLIRNIRNTGPEITLYMESADGIEVNSTAVRILSVDVGRITNIRLRENGSGVEMKARLSADVRHMMRSDTQFWVVKPRIDGSGVSGLNTLVSGSYIAFTPGTSPEEKDSFDVADIPPIAAINQNGLRLQLSGANTKMLDAGAPVIYESLTVGRVESARFDPKTRRTHYSVFIESPNNLLINQSSQFWLDSGIRIKTGGGGIQIDSAPLGALISGAITFRTPDNNGSPAANNDAFELYDDRAAVDNLAGERALYYTAFFSHSVRGLSPGSPVEYKGLRIGSVADVPYFAEGDNLKLFQNGWIPVRIRIEPHLIEGQGRRESKEYWQQNLQTALDRGLNAVLGSDNLVLGSKIIELTDSPSGSPRLRPFADYNGLPVIATRGGGGLEDLQSQLSALLDKFNKLPLDKTLGELNGGLAQLKATLKSANALLAKPQTQAIPAELNKTLAELRLTLQGISPSSPVYRDVQETLKRIDQTLRDAQPILNTLKEKPNALIFEPDTPDPIPQGRR
ncbi:MAG: intermembrane transport protein PqiB [Neisseria sp.]|nr:intermembrane transport protein PqiB [Neisseria sp.]